jgi:tetratricopeptide (TPR) repeat protein
LVHLGLAYLHLGRRDQARQFLLKVVAAAKVSCEHLRQVFGALAIMAIHEGKPHEALATLDKALIHFPAGEYLLYLRAECLYELDRYAEAKHTLAQIINGTGEPQYRGGVPADIREKVAPRRLADVLRLEHDFASAEALAQSIVSRFPDDTHSWHTLGRIYLDSRQRGNLLAVVERLRSCPQGDIFASLLLAVWHLAQHELDSAGQFIDQLISLAPQMPLPRVLRVEWLTQTGAPVANRIQACRDVLRLQPGHLDARRLLNQLEMAPRQMSDSIPDSYSTSVVIGAGQAGEVVSA